MGSAFKLLTLAAGFAILLGFVFLLRREMPAVSKPAGKIDTAPPKPVPPREPPSEPTAPVPEPPAPAPPPSEPKTTADSPRRESYIPEPDKVNIGRQQKADLDAILKASSWEKFYEMCKEGKVGGADYEDVILRRLTAELGLNEEKSTALKKLFKSEQEAATRSIIENCGGAAGFERKKDDLALNSKAIFEEWRSQRDVVRRTKEVDYLKILTYDQLGLVTEHLRNTEIFIETSYTPEGVHYLLGGVGKPPK